MSPISIIATLEVDVPTLDDVKARLAEHRSRCLATEPGTLMFELMAPRDDPSKMYIYEVYADQAAFEAHWHGPSIKRLWEEVAGRCSIAGAIWGSPANGEPLRQ
jgi:autoinducer 2-degrading protein